MNTREIGAEKIENVRVSRHVWRQGFWGE